MINSIDIEIILSAVKQVLSHRDDLIAPEEITGNTLISELELDSLDLAEVLILIEQQIGYELDAFSVQNLTYLQDFTRIKSR